MTCSLHGVSLNSSTELQCTYTENVSQLPKGYLAAQVADTTKVISDYTHSEWKQPQKTRRLYTLLFLFHITLLYQVYVAHASSQ